MNEKKRAPHLIDEPPILVYPSLATALGINKAVVFQQLHFLLNGQKEAKNKYNFVDGRWWVYNSYEEWKETYFPWLAEITIKRIFLDLEEMRIVLSQQSVKNKSDRRKWYTIDYEAWDQKYPTIVSKRYDEPSYQKDTMVVSKRYDDYSETSSETSSEGEDTPPKTNGTLPNHWHGVQTRNDAALIPYLTTWQQAAAINGIEPPIPSGSRGKWLDDADSLRDMGCTPEDWGAYIQERKTNGKKTTWGFAFQDVHEYMAQKKTPEKISAPVTDGKFVIYDEASDTTMIWRPEKGLYDYEKGDTRANHMELNQVVKE